MSGHEPESRPGAGSALIAIARRHPDAVAAAFLAALPFVLLGRALAPGKVLSPADILLALPPWRGLVPGARPANPLLTDVAVMFHPWLIQAAREIREGRFPLWNPHAFAGAPFFANPQTALLFPLTALGWVLPPALALTLIAISKLSLAGLGMYWFLRLLGLPPLPGLAGAVAFMLNGALVAWLGWPAATAMATLPLVFAGVEQVRRHPGRRAVALLALLVGVHLLGGYLQTATLAVVAAGAWALHRSRGASAPGRFLLRVAAGVALGILVASVQLLPFLEYLRESSVYFHRSQWMPAMAAPARSAIALLMPYYFGSPTGGDFWGYWNFNEITATVGIVPWVALPAAALLAWRRPGTRFFLALGGLAAAMAYEVPALTAALARVPPLSLVISHRFVAFLAFSLSALCAIGLAALVDAPPGKAAAGRIALRGGFVALVAAAAGVMLADYPTLESVRLRIPPLVQHGAFLALLTAATLLALRLPRPGPHALALCGLVALEVASLAPLAATYNPVIDRRLFYPLPPAIAHVQAAGAGGGGRVLFASTKNMAALYGLSEVTGYDGMTPRRVEEVVSPAAGPRLLASGSLGLTLSPTSPVFDLLGVTRTIAPPGAPPPAAHFTLEYDGADARVWVNPRAMPRAFVVGARRCVDDGTALRLMHTGAVDLRREVLIAGCEGAPEDAAGAAASPAAGARVTLREPGPHRVLLDVATEAPGYLVLTDTWFTGWRARIDGVEQPVLRANHAFRALSLGAGRHAVEFVYEPASVRYGLAATAVAAAAIAILGLAPRRRTRA